MTLRALDGVVVVLVDTEGSENAGSVARLCGNFGAQLRFVDVRADLASRDCLKMAHPCEDFVRAAPRCAELAEAVADCALVVATSGKIATALEQGPLDTDRAAGFLPPPGERTAIVFGNERTGLPAALARRCHRVVRLPTPGWVDSLNLASSVAVTLTLLAEAARAGRAPRATVAARSRLRDTLEDALTRRGFYKGRGPAAFRPRLDELLGKLDFSDRDVATVQDVIIALAGDRAHG